MAGAPARGGQEAQRQLSFTPRGGSVLSYTGEQSALLHKKTRMSEVRKKTRRDPKRERRGQRTLRREAVAGGGGAAGALFDDATLDAADAAAADAAAGAKKARVFPARVPWRNRVTRRVYDMQRYQAPAPDEIEACVFCMAGRPGCVVWRFPPLLSAAVESTVTQVGREAAYEHVGAYILVECDRLARAWEAARVRFAEMQRRDPDFRPPSGAVATRWATVPGEEDGGIVPGVHVAVGIDTPGRHPLLDGGGSGGADEAYAHVNTLSYRREITARDVGIAMSAAPFSRALVFTVDSARLNITRCADVRARAIPKRRREAMMAHAKRTHTPLTHAEADAWRACNIRNWLRSDLAPVLRRTGRLAPGGELGDVVLTDTVGAAGGGEDDDVHAWDAGA